MTGGTGPRARRSVSCTSRCASGTRTWTRCGCSPPWTSRKQCTWPRCTIEPAHAGSTHRREARDLGVGPAPPAAHPGPGTGAGAQPVGSGHGRGGRRVRPARWTSGRSSAVRSCSRGERSRHRRPSVPRSRTCTAWRHASSSTCSPAPTARTARRPWPRRAAAARATSSSQWVGSTATPTRVPAPRSGLDTNALGYRRWRGRVVLLPARRRPLPRGRHLDGSRPAGAASARSARAFARARTRARGRSRRALAGRRRGRRVPRARLRPVGSDAAAARHRRHPPSPHQGAPLAEVAADVRASPSGHAVARRRRGPRRWRDPAVRRHVHAASSTPLRAHAATPEPQPPRPDGPHLAGRDRRRRRPGAQHHQTRCPLGHDRPCGPG